METLAEAVTDALNGRVRDREELIRAIAERTGSRALDVSGAMPSWRSSSPDDLTFL